MYVTVRELDGPPNSYWMKNWEYHLVGVPTAILWRLLADPKRYHS